MSNFFQSEIVRESIKELELLQQQVIEKTFKTPFMSGDQRKEHVELMKVLLEKQKNPLLYNLYKKIDSVFSSLVK